MNIFTLAHISDLHLACLENISLAQLLNKRILGYFKWRMQRHRKQDPSIATTLIKDIHKTDPGHIIITGDITHLGLPAEFRNASKWLKRLGSPEKISVAPGNHDSYVRTRYSRTFALLQEYMKSDSFFQDRVTYPHTISTNQDLFPTIRITDSTAFIGLSSAVPSPLHVATGRIGDAQLDRLEKLFIILDGLEKKLGRLFRIIYLHHPPLEGTVSHRKRLVDGRRLIQILKKYGCHLILHGHAHRQTEGLLETAIARTPVIGAPAALSIESDTAKGSAWFLFEVQAEGKKSDKFNLTVKKRRYVPEEKKYCWAE